MRRMKTCAGCGAEFTGNCRVKDGERYCQDCEPMAVGRGLLDPDFETPQTIEAYEASKHTIVPVGVLS